MLFWGIWAVVAGKVCRLEGPGLADRSHCKQSCSCVLPCHGAVKEVQQAYDKWVYDRCAGRYRVEAGSG